VGWGDNTYRQLAHADLTATAAPVDVIDEFPEGTVVERVTTGDMHTLVLTADKKLYSFGYNYYGQLGHGANTGSNTPNAPRDITANGALSGRTIDTIVAAGNTSYAVCTDGRNVGWGMNGYGELQVSAPPSYHLPTLKNPSAVQKLWGCGETWFAQNTSNQLFSWGHGQYGQIGNGTSTSTNPYHDIYSNITSSGTLNGKVVAKMSGNNYILAMATDGTLHEWGLIGGPVLSPRAKALPGGRTAVEIFGTSGNGYVVSGYAVADDGTVWSWGGMYDNYYFGQLGNGATSVTDSWTPTEITNSGSLAGKTVVELSGSHNHVIARCSDGSLHGWGANDKYQLVDGGEAAYYVPIELEIEALGPPSITWTTDASLPAASEGVAYSVTLEATPDVVEYEITSGALPSWASFDTATGEISGTPDAVPQTAELSVTAYSTAAVPADRAFTL
jgi:alpha-tubulin suppressor-like RCC1 family protein